jgi:hypothetical protein
VPRRALAVIKRLLDVLRDVLLDVELEHRLLRCGGLVRGFLGTCATMAWSSECLAGGRGTHRSR